MEATMICIDNSEYMRNSDYVPTRFEAQHDAVNLLAGSKTQVHPENTVGILSMASKGKIVEVLVNLTSDFGQLITTSHKAKISGDLNFTSSLNVARLALKHRQNRNQKQRIVAFVGSPVNESTEDLVQLGKKLKKNNISVDIVNFGQEAENTEKLEAFIEAVNRDGSSHLVTVPPGPHILSDILISSAVMRGEGGGEGMEFGVNPEVDPELAMALRMSMEEHEREQQRQQPGATPATPQPAAAGGDQMIDEDEEMRLAIEMSLAESNSAPAPSSTPAPAADLSNPDYVNALLSSLPGVDVNDPRVQTAIQGSKPADEDVEMQDKSGDKSQGNSGGQQ